MVCHKAIISTESVEIMALHTTGIASALGGLVAHYEGQNFSPKKVREKMLEETEEVKYSIFDLDSKTETKEKARLFNPYTIKVK